jgi:hypothetical protein
MQGALWNDGLRPIVGYKTHLQTASAKPVFAQHASRSTRSQLCLPTGLSSEDCHRFLQVEEGVAPLHGAKHELHVGQGMILFMGQILGETLCLGEVQSTDDTDVGIECSGLRKSQLAVPDAIIGEWLKGLRKAKGIEICSSVNCDLFQTRLAVQPLLLYSAFVRTVHSPVRALLTSLLGITSTMIMDF